MWQAIGVLLAPLKRTAFWAASFIHKTTRPRVMIMRDNDVLLVRNWGEKKWSLPGGGVHRGESARKAARRECKEELGLVLPDRQLHYLTTIELAFYIAPLYWCAYDPALGQPRVDRFEVIDCAWFSRHQLPELGEGTAQLLAQLENVPTRPVTGSSE